MKTKILSMVAMMLVAFTLIFSMPMILANHNQDHASQVGDQALSVASEKSKASTNAFWDNIGVKIASNKQENSKEGIKNALRATIIAEKKLEVRKEKVAGEHSKILERQKERMSEEKIARLNEKFSKIETQTEKAQARIDQKQENLIARYKLLTGATDEEVEALMNELEAEVEAKF